MFASRSDDHVLRSVCVFCGSNPGRDPRYGAAAADMGREIADRGMRLVYGGGRTGLMGRVADAALEHGGEAVGVIPRALMDREVGHTGLTELRLVDSMHERKATMAGLADAFIALPGGLGTLEEIFEVWTWTQLGVHRKPIGFLNIAGFFDPLVEFLEGIVAEAFLRPSHRDLAVFSGSPAELLVRLSETDVPAVSKWLELDQA